MLAHATKASYIYIYISVHIWRSKFLTERAKRSNCVWKDEWGRRWEPILFTSVCQRHVLVASEGLTMENWRFYFHAPSFLLRLSDFIFHLLFPFFPNSNRWKFPSTDHPPPFVYLRHSRHLLHDHHRKLSTALSRAILLGSHDRR